MNNTTNSSLSKGFTLLEMMIVLAVIAIIAFMSVPNTHHKVSRRHIIESINLVEPYKTNIATIYHATGEFPKNNHEAGLPDPNKIIGNYLVRMELENGGMHLYFGNKIHKSLTNKRLSIRPVYVPDTPQAPVSWICGHSQVPSGMQSSTNNLSNIDNAYLPLDCRAL